MGEAVGLLLCHVSQDRQESSAEEDVEALEPTRTVESCFGTGNSSR